MVKQTINIGTVPNDMTGDTLRNSFDKINDNFDELYDRPISEAPPQVSKSINNNYTLIDTDVNKRISVDTNIPISITIPLGLTLGSNKYTIISCPSYPCQITSVSGVTLNGINNNTFYCPINGYVIVYYESPNVWTAFGVQSNRSVEIYPITTGATRHTHINTIINVLESLGGGVLKFNPGTYIINSSVVMKPLVRIEGSGRYSTIIKLLAANTSTSVIIGNNCDKAEIAKMTLDGGFIDNTFGSHGITIFDSDDLLIEDMFITNYKNSGIVLYSSNGAVQILRPTVRDIRLDGLTTAQNGILFVDTKFGKMVNVVVDNISFAGDPGYAVQLKGNSQYNRVDFIASNSRAGLAFGQETGNGADYNFCTGIALNCNNGFVAGFAVGNIVQILIDGNDNTSLLEAIRLENSSSNTILASVHNAPTNKNVVRLVGSVEVPSNDNQFWLGFVGKGTNNTVNYEVNCNNNATTINTVRRSSQPLSSQQLLTDAGTGNKIEYLNGGTLEPRLRNTASSGNLLNSDEGGHIFLTNSSVNTLTIQLDATILLRNNSKVTIVREGNANHIIQAVAGVTLNGVDGGSYTLTIANQSVQLYKKSTNTWSVFV